jgi:hypothetical protein
MTTSGQMMRTVALVIVVAVFSQGCAELGYRDRVLHRVPSPRDGTLIALCQEVPAFDGPGYDIRLERGDGTLVRRLPVVTPRQDLLDARFPQPTHPLGTRRVFDLR